MVHNVKGAKVSPKLLHRSSIMMSVLSYDFFYWQHLTKKGRRVPSWRFIVMMCVLSRGSFSCTGKGSEKAKTNKDRKPSPKLKVRQIAEWFWASLSVMHLLLGVKPRLEMHDWQNSGGSQVDGSILSEFFMVSQNCKRTNVLSPNCRFYICNWYHFKMATFIQLKWLHQ